MCEKKNITNVKKTEFVTDDNNNRRQGAIIAVDFLVAATVI